MEELKVKAQQEENRKNSWDALEEFFRSALG